MLRGMYPLLCCVVSEHRVRAQEVRETWTTHACRDALEVVVEVQEPAQVEFSGPQRDRFPVEERDRISITKQHVR